MGGGVSHTSLPDKMSQYDLIEFCKEIPYVNSELLFISLKDLHNVIDKNLFLYIINNDMEKEILTLYWSYCAGEMDIGEFTRFCYDTKLLKKSTFTKADAQNVFKNFKPANQSVINYNILRFSIFPEVSCRLDISQNDLIQKLSTFDPPAVHDNGEENIHRNISEMSETDLIRHYAGLKLQRHWRAGLARRAYAKKKQLHYLHSHTDVQLADFVQATVTQYQLHASTPNPSHTPATALSEEEQTCRRVFDKFSDDKGYMNARGFVQFCFYTEIIPLGGDARLLDFTRADATYAFEQIIALHYRPSDRTYGEGVKLGKRIAYSVFRGLLVGTIATQKKMTVEELLRHIECVVSQRASDKTSTSHKE